MTRTAAILIFIFCLCMSAAAQIDLSGTWQGKLAISPNESITVQITISKQAGGSYTAMLDSPDSSAIKNVPASAVKISGTVLTIDVASLSGSYSGTVGKEIITGEWKQEGNSLPLVLTPYRKASLASLKPILGEWTGEMILPGQGSTAVAFRFEVSKQGDLAAYFNLPEQGAKIPATNVALENSLLTFSIPNAKYEGKLIESRIEGVIKQGGVEIKLNLTRGKYEAPGSVMPAEDMKRLLGQWIGKYSPGGPTNTFIWKFERRTDGKMAALASAPELSPQVLPITDISIKGDQVTFKLPSAQGEVTATISSDSLAGTYNANGTEYGFSAIRGAKYEPAAANIPPETMTKLLGRWNGKIATIEIVVRFERNSAGESAIFLDIPAQGAKDIIVTNAAIKESILSMTLVGAAYTGTLNGGTITGNLKAPNQPEIPLTLTKETSK